MLTSKFRPLAAGIVLLAALAHLLNSGYRDWNAGGDSAYVLILLFLFFVKERVEDERVRELKLKALTVAFGVGYVTTFASKLVLRYTVRRPDPDLPTTISAVDFMFVVLVAALGLFYYWRFEDGKASRAE